MAKNLESASSPKSSEGCWRYAVPAVWDAGLKPPEALQNNQSNLPAEVHTPSCTNPTSKPSYPAKSTIPVPNSRTCWSLASSLKRWSERSGDEALRRHRPRCRAEGSHQPPRHPTASTPVTGTPPRPVRQQMALFEDIVKAAGKTLNNTTFNRGGESLTHLTLPGGLIYALRTRLSLWRRTGVHLRMDPSGGHAGTERHGQPISPPVAKQQWKRTGLGNRAGGQIGSVEHGRCRQTNPSPQHH